MSNIKVDLELLNKQIITLDDMICFYEEDSEENQALEGITNFLSALAFELSEEPNNNIVDISFEVSSDED